MTTQELKYPEMPTTDFVATTMTRESFSREHPVSEGRTLIALGYGPLGNEDPNFSPTFRRRYYLTLEKLLAQVKFVFDNLHRFLDPDVRLEFENLIGDMSWFLRSRENIHKGTTPSTQRVSNPNPTFRR